MASLNKVFLMGNLTREPELRYTPSGSAVCEFGIAVNRRGQDRDETCFVEIIVWEKQAEACGKFIQKGSQVFIEGRLQYDQWVDKEQKKRSRLRVTAERVQFLERRDMPQGGEQPYQQAPQSAPGYRQRQVTPQDGPDGGYAPRSQYRSQYQQDPGYQQQAYRPAPQMNRGGLPPQAPMNDPADMPPPMPPEDIAGIEDDIPF
jgi:single-strand DNA-binding protein